MDLDPSEIARLNKGRYPGLGIHSRLQQGTSLIIRDTTHDDLYQANGQETIDEIAEEHGLTAVDVLAINKNLGTQDPDVKLEEGREVWIRDREAEPDIIDNSVSFRGGAREEMRQVDNGELGQELNEAQSHGDPDGEGVVWPKIAEIGLLAGLGSGGLLIRHVIGELIASGEYEYAVMQSTPVAVSFYERLGFKRVGAMAKYGEKEQDIDEVEEVGYCHWTYADEREVEEQGGISYMMCLKLSDVTAKNKTRISASKMATTWPPIKAMPGAIDLRGYQGVGAGGDVILTIGNDGEARVEIQYEVRDVIDKRTHNGKTEYLVRWTNAGADTWEPVAHLGTADTAIKAFEREYNGGSSGRGANAAQSRGRGRGRQQNRRVPGARAGSEGAERRLYNKVVELSGAATTEGKKVGNYKYWFVLHYDMATSQCQLAPLQPSGKFTTGAERIGRVRWKAVPEGDGKEIYVAAAQCKVLWAEPVNKVSDVDKEAWDILENAAPNSSGGGKKRKGDELYSSKTGKSSKQAAPPALRKQPNVPSGVPGLWNKVVTVQGHPGHWFVMNYEPEVGEVRLGAMDAIGVFGERSGARMGRARWKVLTEKGSLLEEIEVDASACEVIRAECVNKTADVEREAWDLESGLAQGKKGKNKKGGKVEIKKPELTKAAAAKGGGGTSKSKSHKRQKTEPSHKPKAAAPVAVKPEVVDFVDEDEEAENVEDVGVEGFVYEARRSSRGKSDDSQPEFFVKGKDSKGNNNMLQKTIDFFWSR